MLNYKQYGNQDGPLIIFLHGGGVSSWMWDKQIEYFTNYHCVTVDLPEHGLNKYRGPFSIEDSAQKVLELIEQIANNCTVIVIGFSLGAQVLIQMISMNEHLVHYAMINSALVRPSKLGEKTIAPLIKLTYPLIKNKAFARLQAKTLLIDDDYFNTYYKESSQTERETLIRILRENMSFKIPQPFQHANVNMLVTVGEKEKTIMKKSAIDITHTNSHCKSIIISGVGHGAPYAKSQLFNVIIDNWLKKECLT